MQALEIDAINLIYLEQDTSKHNFKRALSITITCLQYIFLALSNKKPSAGLSSYWHRNNVEARF